MRIEQPVFVLRSRSFSSAPVATSRAHLMTCPVISFPVVLLCFAVALPALAAERTPSIEAEWKQTLKDFKGKLDPPDQWNAAEKKWWVFLEEFRPSQTVQPAPSGKFLCQQLPRAPAGWKREEVRCEDFDSSLSGVMSEAQVSYSKNGEGLDATKMPTVVSVMVMDNGGNFPILTMQTALDVLRPSRPPLSKPKMRAVLMGAWPAAVDETGLRVEMVVGHRYFLFCEGRAVSAEFTRSFAMQIATQLASLK